VAVAVDMRRRLLGPALLPGAALPTGSHESLPDAIGNFFGTAILEGALPADAPLSSLAAGLRAAIMRCVSHLHLHCPTSALSLCSVLSCLSLKCLSLCSVLSCLSLRFTHTLKYTRTHMTLHRPCSLATHSQGL
jgi:hypothetical protein